MGIRGKQDLIVAIRRALTSAAVFAQALLVCSPLVEVRDAEVHNRVLAAGVSTPGITTMAADRGTASHHNATTCPACIAQSLHAQVVSPVRMPTFVIGERAVSQAPGVVAAHHDPPSAHHSRAPPALS
jgi:N-acetylglutamate synthase/N-acetylornithine aminotransferase